MASSLAKPAVSMAERWKRAKEKVAKIQGKAEETIGTAIQTAEIGVAAGAFGYANERYGQQAGELSIVKNVPADLAFGLTMHVVSFFGAFGKYSEHGHNLGDGALAAFAYRKGAEMGRNAKAHAVKGHDDPWQVSAGAPRVDWPQNVAEKVVR